jgi:hypothetical protein
MTDQGARQPSSFGPSETGGERRSDERCTLQVTVDLPPGWPGGEATEVSAEYLESSVRLTVSFEQSQRPEGGALLDTGRADHSVHGHHSAPGGELDFSEPATGADDRDAGGDPPHRKALV